MDKQFIIPESVLQRVINYLAEQPFKEVNPLIVAVQQNAKEYVAPKAEEKPEDQTDEKIAKGGKK